jgi:signal transduction histidine kinase
MLDHGDLKLNPTRFNLKKLVDSVICIFETKAEKKSISLEGKVDSGIDIVADETFFRQVVANLVNNSIKFTPEEGHVRCLSEKRDGQISLVVSDTGIGMPDDITLENVFDDNLVKTRRGTHGEKGTGIGLTICKKILDAHHFGLTFRSKPDKGTQFIIEIPSD